MRDSSPLPVEETEQQLIEDARAERPGFLALAAPAALANLLMSLVGIINIKMVSTLGTSAVAAVTTSNRVFFIFQALLIATNAGTTAMVAKYWGARQYDEAAEVLKTSLVLNSLIAVISSLIIYLFSESFAHIFDHDELTLAFTAEYLAVFGLFTIGFAFNLTFGAALRAAGDARVPLYLGALANVFTVFISYVLIFGEFGFPKLGLIGSAIGASGFLVAGLVFFFLWGTDRLVIKKVSSLSLNKSHIKRLVEIGYPTGLEQLVIQAGLFLYLWVVSFYGTEAFAAWGIGVTILSFSFVVGLGFSIAASTLVGQNLGAGDIAEAKASGWRAMRLSVLAMTILGGAIVASADVLANFLVDDPVVVQHTVTFIYMLGAMQPFMAIDFALAGALRGAGDTKFPLYSTLTGLIVFRATISLMLLKLEFSIDWIYAALIIDYFVKALMLVYRFNSEKWAYLDK